MSVAQHGVEGDARKKRIWQTYVFLRHGDGIAGVEWDEGVMALSVAKRRSRSLGEVCGRCLAEAISWSEFRCDVGRR